MEKLIIGKPVSPMLVKESGTSDGKYKEIIKKHNGTTFTEVKSDGYRIQVHSNGGIKLFTRNLNEFNPAVFPDLKKQFEELPYGIFDGELVGVEDGIKGFNSVKKRVRDELDLNLVNEYPLQIKFFDVLNAEGNDYINLPLHERREILNNYVSNVSEQEIVNSAESLKRRFDEVTSRGLEGLVCKNPDSEYIIGGRTHDWIKLKNFLTLDLVILGLYKGDGKAGKLPFAGVLLGSYNSNTNKYETIAKVGLSGKDKVNEIYERIKAACVNNAPNNIIISDIINKKSYARKKPFCYVKPEHSLVLETQALNITYSKNWHSCGLENGTAHSLRIPIVGDIRYDKTPKESTTSSQIREIYES
ncbi:MAG: ATP-dependent DNA ligase [Candidatus Nanoarchaeia archaeon]|nr:ATP-dependent DNA ligase [Candidatus Nanoarchaeia archaeon]MDD5740709.1 ATP-dependent DNA ligase [Candidatus Nanoarchaeia archaeon]